MKETTKAFSRRKADPFWKDIFIGDGLDIGSGDDPFQKDWFPGVRSIRPFDWEDGDAQVTTRYFPPCSFDFVHSSNCLEHMRNPCVALMEWYALLKPGGYLVLTVPDEDLYEQRVFPSQWNNDHRWTFTVWKENSWSKRSFNIVEMLAALHRREVRRIQIADTNYDRSLNGVDQTYEGDAEAFIEVVVRKGKPISGSNLTFKHSGARGDLVYGMPAMKALGGGTLKIAIDESSYLGAPLDAEGVRQLRELLTTQDYVDDVISWDGNSVDFDLDDFRDINIDANLLSMGHLVRFGTAFDLSQPWLTVEPKYAADIVVNRTWRYHGRFDWQELAHWVDRAVFVGAAGEHEIFQKQTGLIIPFHPTPTYLELAQIIAGSKLFVGNQSFPYSLAEAMKVPRVLEVCPTCPNCMPQTENGHIMLTQAVLRHYLEGEPFVDMQVKKAHLPWRLRPLKEPKTSRDKSVATGRAHISCIIPFREGHLMALSRFSKSALTAGAEVVVVGDFIESEKSLPKGVKVVQGTGGFEVLANAGAEAATGDVLCVVDVGACDSFSVAEAVAIQLQSSRLGIVGSYMSTDAYPHPTGPCVAVPRRAYELCGLFNDEMTEGPLNYLEMSLRYAARRYGCKSVGLGSAPCRRKGDEANAAYIGKTYGVKM